MCVLILLSQGCREGEARQCVQLEVLSPPRFRGVSGKGCEPLLSLSFEGLPSCLRLELESVNYLQLVFSSLRVTGPRLPSLSPKPKDASEGKQVQVVEPPPPPGEEGCGAGAAVAGIPVGWLEERRLQVSGCGPQRM